MLACRSTHGMTWKISSWNIRPRGSPIFRAASHGDFEKIVKLISDGEASLYDRDEGERTLLHVSPPRDTYKERVYFNQQISSTQLKLPTLN